MVDRVTGSAFVLKPWHAGLQGAVSRPRTTSVRHLSMIRDQRLLLQGEITRIAEASATLRTTMDSGCRSGLQTANRIRSLSSSDSGPEAPPAGGITRTAEAPATLRTTMDSGCRSGLQTANRIYLPSTGRLSGSIPLFLVTIAKVRQTPGGNCWLTCKRSEAAQDAWQARFSCDCLAALALAH